MIKKNNARFPTVEFHVQHNILRNTNSKRNFRFIEKDCRVRFALSS